VSKWVGTTEGFADKSRMVGVERDLGGEIGEIGGTSPSAEIAGRSVGSVSEV